MCLFLWIYILTVYFTRAFHIDIKSWTRRGISFANFDERSTCLLFLKGDNFATVENKNLPRGHIKYHTFARVRV